MPAFKHRVLALDVWGNAKDGFEVNQMFRTSGVVDISTAMTDEEVIKAIRGACGHPRDASGYYVSGDSDNDHMIFIYDNKEGKPCYFTQLAEW